MSPWSALLESLHSAWIDELTERHPEPKPELGLPLRQNRFALPAQDASRFLLAEISFPESHAQGIGLIATQDEFARALGIDVPTLWEAILHRARPELQRRGIQPKFAQPVEFSASDAFPSSTLKCARVIWIPIRIAQGQCYLGIGA